jgi:UDP-N-acetylmuramoyl-tripeptide--D-alanyl-D-alanine ligase
MLQRSHIWQGLIDSKIAMPEGLDNRPITDVVIDSRLAQAGSLFVALRGEKTDGHLYLGDAFERGASTAIAEPHALELGLAATFVMPDGTLLAIESQSTQTSRGTTSQDLRTAPPVIFIVPDAVLGLQKLAAFWRAQMPAAVVAITGSVGKTTTKETVANVLAQRFTTLRSSGNLNNELGLPLVLLQLSPEHQRVVLEMGMYASGEIARLCEIARPRIGIVTNVGPTHLERMGSVERIAKAKSELVQALPPASDGGIAVLNGDDSLVRAMRGLTKARVFSYGLTESNDLWADEIASEGLEGIRFRFHYRKEILHLKVPMLGRHSVHTALRGAAAGLAEGLSWEEIIGGLQDVRGQLRLMVVSGVRDTTLIDDTYNASPASMLAALNLLEDIIKEPGTPKQHKRRSIAVLGEMFELGSYEEEGHRLVGGRAAQVVTKLVTVGQRARWIAEEALSSGMQPADVHPVVSNADAVAILQGLMRPGDVVLIKGSRSAAMESIVDALSRSRSGEG